MGVARKFGFGTKVGLVSWVRAWIVVCTRLRAGWRRRSPGGSGQYPHALSVSAVPTWQPQAAEVTTKEKVDMNYAVIFAFVVVAGAPLVGIWRGHMWAKANGMVLRASSLKQIEAD